MLLLFTCPPVRGVCPNHEGVMLQPQKVNPLYLGSVINCYVSYSFKPTPPFSSLRPVSTWGGGYPYPYRPYLPFPPPCGHTGSFSHLGVTFLSPSILRPINSCIRLLPHYFPVSSAPAKPAGFPTPLPCHR